jgi:hypothetical protein
MKRFLAHNEVIDVRRRRPAILLVHAPWIVEVAAQAGMCFQPLPIRQVDRVGSDIIDRGLSVRGGLTVRVGRRSRIIVRIGDAKLLPGERRQGNRPKVARGLAGAMASGCLSAHVERAHIGAAQINRAQGVVVSGRVRYRYLAAAEPVEGAFETLIERAALRVDQNILGGRGVALGQRYGISKVEFIRLERSGNRNAGGRGRQSKCITNSQHRDRASDHRD